MRTLTSKLKAIDFRPTGLVEKLSEAMTEAILEGIFKEGDQLTELDLQKQFNISRTPIRESLCKLTADGFLEQDANRGLLVLRLPLAERSGVNRLSVGVQSFDDFLLRQMERFHKYGSGRQIRDRLAHYMWTFDTLNVDMIFNFPTQTMAMLEPDLDIIEEIQADQVTFYPLMPSPHKKSAMERRFARVDNSREIKYYNLILKDIYDQGYQASTVWCFSKGTRMIDEYIVDYEEYLGVGPGSFSYLDGNIFFLEYFSPQSGI